MSNRTKTDGQQVDLVAMMNRHAVIEELKSGRHKQKRGDTGAWWDPEAPTCWAGVAARVLYKTEKRMNELSPWLFVNLASELKMDIQRFVAANDVGYGFPELAEMMAEAPLPTTTIAPHSREALQDPGPEQLTPARPNVGRDRRST